MKAKAIIEQETAKTPGDIWRELRDKTKDIVSYVEKLKAAAPGFEKELDAIVAAHEAKVAEAAKAVQKTKVQSPTDLLANVISGDPFGEKKDFKSVNGLLKAINAMGWKPKFVFSEQDTDMDPNHDLAQSLNDEYDIEVDPDELLPFVFIRGVNNRNQLAYIDGSILPDGQIYVGTMSSDRVDDGSMLFSNVQELVDTLRETWDANEFEGLD